MQIEIRRKPVEEQYPEIWNALKSANETLSRIATTQEAQNDRQTKISGWQRHFDGHLENAFTNVNLKYLRENKPNVTHEDFINIELINFSVYDCERSHPSMESKMYLLKKML